MRLDAPRRTPLGRRLLVAALVLLPAPPLPAQPPRAEAVRAEAVRAERGMVVSASAIASAVGRDVLAAGGNAIDAAVATGFALAVTYPAAGNVGGGGFMVVRWPDGRATTVDFREKAPAAARPRMFVDSAGQYSARIHHSSYTAVGVPGTVAGFALAHRKYGKTPWARVVDPAVALARDGFDLPAGLAESLAALLPTVGAYPATVAAYSKAGTPYAVGERFRQPDLARTLARVRDRGQDGFYRGETARLLAREMRRGGGLITERDLAAYRARERAPVRGTYRGYEVVSMPPPSSGGVALVEMLNILEGYDLAALGRGTPRQVHLLAEAMRRAYLDRARHLGDPDFVTVPVARLTSKAHADALRKSIVADRATRSEPAQVADVAEPPETTHYSVVDASGLAVSVTYTLEGGYGVKAVVPGAGFLLNNEMGDFNAVPGVTDTTGRIGSAPNVARPGKRMLSSMTPTILARDGELVAVVGSPGGRTIINTVLQVVLNLVDHGMGIQEAVDAPRLHHQWLPDRIVAEQDGLPPETAAALRAMGHTVLLRGRQGTAHSILIDRATGARLGAADRRDRDAGAAGY